MRRVAAIGLAAGCYAPTPPTGAPCPEGVCPTPLVCSPVTQTCEREDGSADGGPRPDGADPVVTPEWRYRVPVTIDAPAAATNAIALVVLDATFAYGHAATDASDLRAGDDDQTNGFEVPHWIESWAPGATSRVWLRVPNLSAGANTVYLFYGHDPIAPTSDFATVFPNSLRSTGDLALVSDVTTDAVILEAGHTATIPQGELRTLTAAYVQISGTVNADGSGYAGGAGPGAGGTSGVSGAGGGGHGGTGGTGGRDNGDAGGVGGVAYGSPTSESIDLGSGGGVTAAATTGGRGGGALRIVATRAILAGAITARGLSGSTGARASGGGAGGGLLVQTASLAFTGTLDVSGGSGGNASTTAGDGGGGGAGGRIKLFHRGDAVITGNAVAAGGAPGAFGEIAATMGGSGTTEAGQTSMVPPLPTVGAEQSL